MPQAMSWKEFARAFVLALMGASQFNEENTEDYSKQLDLFYPKPLTSFNPVNSYFGDPLEQDL